MNEPAYIELELVGKMAVRFFRDETGGYTCRMDYGLIAQLKDAQTLASDPSGLVKRATASMEPMSP